jgi:CRISPR/Cas system CMR-associated protein Cmr5 small subunit
MKTIERTIAGKARELVEKRRGDTEYRTHCESLPMLLRSAGLAQTAVYLQTKQQKVYEDLDQQVRDLGLLKRGLSEQSTDPSLSLAEYRTLSEIAMIAAVWHKRMAQALIPKPPKEPRK